MKPLFYFVLLTVLSHVGFVGSRITVSLSAINQGASPLAVGVLMSLYAVIPMLLAVQAGRLVDRVGAFRPIAIAGAIVAAGMLLPFASHELPMLFVSAAVVGTAFMMQHIALNHVIGNLGDPSERPVNFSWFALGYSVSGFLGPLLAGFAIDLAGHRAAFLLLALPPAAGTALLLWKRRRCRAARTSARPMPRRHQRRRPAAQPAPAAGVPVQRPARHRLGHVHLRDPDLRHAHRPVALRPSASS